MTDITVGASEDAFQEFFNHVKDNFSFARSDSDSVGPFVAKHPSPRGRPTQLVYRGTRPVGEHVSSRS